MLNTVALDFPKDVVVILPPRIAHEIVSLLGPSLWDPSYAIHYVYRIDCIDRIYPGVLDFSELQLKYNLNEPTNSGTTFWGKEGERFEVTGIYRNFQIFHEVCLRNK